MVATKSEEKVVYENLGVRVLQGEDRCTGEDAMEMLGWTTEADQGRVGFRDEFTLKFDKEKVRLVNVPDNRPFRMFLAKRYALEILRGKWKLNGESIIIDRLGHVQNGQHRLVGLLLAIHMWREERSKWPFWEEEPTMEILVVTGIDPSPEVVDTLDTGQKRSLADVLYRNRKFADLKPRDQKTATNWLSAALKLTWTRAGGKSLSTAPHFPHSEALDWLDKHPEISDSVMHIWELEGKRKQRKISKFIAPGMAAGLLFLMETSGTDPDEYDELDQVDWSMQDKAREFWHRFAEGLFGKGEESSPIRTLRDNIRDLDSSGITGRDEIIGTVCKAFNFWSDGKDLDWDGLRLRKVRNDVDKLVLAENPRVGGIDTVVEEREDSQAMSFISQASKEIAGDDEEEEEAPPVAAAKKDKPNWAKGDEVTVADDKGDWMGEVVSVRSDAVIVKDEEGNQYECSYDELH